MTNSVDETWMADVEASLAALRVEHMPSLELLFLDGVITWVFGPDNPGRGYSDEHGAAIGGALLTAADEAAGFNVGADLDCGRSVESARAAVVAGAHLLADSPRGVTKLITRILPATIGELERNASDRVDQVQSCFVYPLLALATGTNDEPPSESVSEGLLASFDVWDRALADGLVLPSRR